MPALLHILPTKLHQPRPNAYIIERTQLLARLNESLERSITLICAPAGYGKTTLAAQWLTLLAHGQSNLQGSSSAGISVWLTLDEHDSEITRFLSCLVSAIQSVYPQSCHNTTALLAGLEPAPVAHLTHILLEELAQLPGPRLFLVLDDYHVVQDATVHRFMAQLVRNLPQQLHLVIVSRTEPPIAMARLRISGQLRDVRMSDLRFSTQETSDYLERSHCHGISDEHINQLVQVCEGWVAGIQTAVLSLWEGTTPPNLLHDLNGGQRRIMDYLVEEVLAHQPAHIYDFLLKSSIVKRFSVSLCDTLLNASAQGSSDQMSDAQAIASAEILEYLEHENLFLISLDEQRKWYRYHHLFQNLLHKRLLVHHNQQEIEKLHQRACAWFEAHGLLDDALDHGLAIGATPAAQFVEAHAHEMLDKEEIQTLERWLRQLSKELLWERPRLLAVQACLLTFSGRYIAMPPLLDQAEKLLEQDSTKLDVGAMAEVRASIAGSRSIAYYFTDLAPEQALVQTEQGLAFLQDTPGQHAWLHGNITVSWGHALLATGQMSKVTQECNRRLAQHTGPYDAYSLRLWQLLCFVHLADDDLVQLEDAATSLLRHAGESGLDLCLGWAHLFLGIAYYERNQLEKAETHFQATVALRYRTHQRCIRNGLLGLALIRHAVGQPEETQHYIAAAYANDQGVETASNTRPIRSTELHIMLMDGHMPATHIQPKRPELDFDHRIISSVELPQHTYAHWLLRLGTSESLAEAEVLLLTIICGAERCYMHRQAIPALALQALVFAAQKRTLEAHNSLEQALALAQSRGVVRVFLDLGANMAQLLAELQSRSAYGDYIALLLAQFHDTQFQVAAPQLQTLSIRPTSAQTELVEPLTMREIEILKLIAEHHSNDEIAALLVVSTNTVKKHISNIYGKLGVARRGEAVQRARQHMLLPA